MRTKSKAASKRLYESPTGDAIIRSMAPRHFVLLFLFSPFYRDPDQVEVLLEPNETSLWKPKALNGIFRQVREGEESAQAAVRHLHASTGLTPQYVDRLQHCAVCTSTSEAIRVNCYTAVFLLNQADNWEGCKARRYGYLRAIGRRDLVPGTRRLMSLAADVNQHIISGVSTFVL